MCIAEDKTVVTGWSDGFIRCFEITKHPFSPMVWEIADAHNSQIGAISCIYVDANYIISGGCDGLVRVWSRKIRKLSYQIACHKKKITAAFPDILQSHIVHSCSLDKTVHSFDLKKNKKVIFHTQNNGNFPLSNCDFDRSNSGHVSESRPRIGTRDLWTKLSNSPMGL